MLSDSLSSVDVIARNHTDCDSGSGDVFDGLRNLLTDSVLNTENGNESVTRRFNVFDNRIFGVVCVSFFFLGDVFVGDGDRAEGCLSEVLDAAVNLVLDGISYSLSLSIDVDVMGARVADDISASLKLDSSVLGRGLIFLVVESDGSHSLAARSEGETNHVGSGRDDIRGNASLNN